jgi:hypothetical protein
MSVGYINYLYAKIEKWCDPNGGSHIRDWMRSRNITFDELNFTEAELEAKMQRVTVRYINYLYAKIDQGYNPDPNGGSHIRDWMRSRNITFDELNFTEAELEAKMQRINESV